MSFSSASKEKIRVLLVEDSIAEARLVCDALAFVRHPEVEVTHAWRLGDALADLAAAQYDVVMLDLGLPDSQGLDGLGRVQEAAPATAIIVRTGHSDERLAMAALAAGAQDYLVKEPGLTVELIKRSILFALARSQADQASRQLAAIIDSSEDAIISKSLDGTITTWNRAAERMYGYSAHEAIGMHISMLACSAEQQQEFAEIIQHVAGGEGIVHFETTRRRRDGVVIHVSLTVSSIRGLGESIAGVSSSARDITAQRRVEHERVRALAGLREAQRIANVGSFAWDPRTDEASWTEELYRIFGRDPGRGPAVGVEFLDYVRAENRQLLIAGQARTLQGGPEFQVDFRIVADDGAERTVHAVGRADPDCPGGYMGTIQDVTELRATELALIASQAELLEQGEVLSGVIDNAPIGMALVAPDGSWLRLNRALCELGGYTEEQLRELNFLEMTHPDDRLADLKQITQLLDGEITKYQSEKRSLHRDGHYVWISVSVSLIRDADGAPRHFIAQVKDISERKRAEAELQRLATHDPLTGLPNQRAFHTRLAGEVANANRHGHALGLIVLDLDHFKQINDVHGHLVGDRVLEEAARRLAGVVREGELLARVGGEEFAWIVPNTDGDGAYAAAERARLAIRETPFEMAGELSLSAGVCVLSTGADELELYQYADEALYLAKRSGRNQSVLFGAVGAPVSHA